MIFGGIPYYLSLFEKGLSFTQNVDKLCFAKQAKLKNEFAELFSSLFKRPDRHIEIVLAMASKRSGMSLKEICEYAKIPFGGNVTKTMDDLEQCGFIKKYSDFTKRKRGTQFYLVDSFTLFYLEFIKNNTFKDEYYWTNFIEDGHHRAWSGYAFEQLCRLHLPQIKRKLGISGVSTSTTSWKSNGSAPGAQIDLVIKRNDGVINLCEMKYTKHEFTISKDYANELEKKASVFRMESKTKYAIHITMITTYGVSKTGHFSIMQSEVTLDDLFAEK
jgi:DNA-binding MarR family transcriptional regulator